MNRALWVLLALCACRDPNAPLPRIYTAHRAERPPVVDGRLDDEVWTRARSTGRFPTSSGRGEPHFRTEARLAWDDTHLYVAFDCEDDDVWSKFTKRDDPIYEQEAVEIFLDADRDLATYNEIELSPADVLFDAYFPARRQGMDLAWDSGTVGKALVRGTLNDPSDADQGWTAELAIPFARLARVPKTPPRQGDLWRFNLYRLDMHSGRTAWEGQAFSPPVEPDFHNLPKFGYLEFAK